MGWVAISDVKVFRLVERLLTWLDLCYDKTHSRGLQFHMSSDPRYNSRVIYNR